MREYGFCKITIMESWKQKEWSTGSKLAAQNSDDVIKKAST
jgi:hypothetical protein